MRPAVRGGVGTRQRNAAVDLPGDKPMKIPRRYYNPVFSFVMSLMMSFLMSGVITFINLGWVHDFMLRWLLHAFPSAWAVAFPLSLFVVPVVRRLVARMVAET